MIGLHFIQPILKSTEKGNFNVFVEVEGEKNSNQTTNKI